MLGYSTSWTPGRQSPWARIFQFECCENDCVVGFSRFDRMCANFGNFDLPLLKKSPELGHRPTRSNPRALRALVRARFARASLLENHA